MNKNPELVDYFLKRRSVTLPFLAEPAPSADELGTILTIASRVPDHGKLVPWRMITYSGDQRVEVGARLGEVAKANNPNISDVQLEIERNQFLPAPITIGVLSATKMHPKVPEFEQLISAGCVAFNLVHAAFALGFGAHWVTRWFAYDHAAAAMLGAKEDERFVAFVHIGTPTARMDERARPELADVVSAWQPI